MKLQSNKCLVSLLPTDRSVLYKSIRHISVGIPKKACLYVYMKYAEFTVHINTNSSCSFVEDHEYQLKLKVTIQLYRMCL